MNDRNEEDVGKYIDVRNCEWLVDTVMVGDSGTEIEPVYAEMEEWQRVKCERFLDVGRTGVMGRVIWVPESEWVPKAWRRVWGEMCLLKRKDGEGVGR